MYSLHEVHETNRHHGSRVLICVFHQYRTLNSYIMNFLFILLVGFPILVILATFC